MTIYANAPGTLSMLLLVPTIVLFLLLPIGRGTPNSTSLHPDSVFSIHNRALIQASMSPLPVLSILDRAHVMLMTVLSILAVDFRVFPVLLLNPRLMVCHWYHHRCWHLFEPECAAVGEPFVCLWVE